MSQQVKRLAVLAGMLGVVLLPAAHHAVHASTSAGQADFATQVAEYVRAQEALAADDFEGAQIALGDLIAIADDVIGPLARAAASAADIASMRSAFKPLSELLAGRDLPVGFARAYCPMYDGGSNWVQIDGPVRNPYYGSVMLTCGVVVHSLLGVPVRVTSPARTVVDCFRYRNKIGLDLALEALHDALRLRLATADQIMSVADACRARSVVSAYLQAALVS